MEQQVIKTGSYSDRPARDYTEFQKVIYDLINEGYSIVCMDYFTSGYGTIVVTKKQ